MLSPDVTVCIFAWNEEKRILRCAENFRDTFKVLVVDNCSSDNTVAVAEAAGLPCVQIKNPGYIETPEVMGPLMEVCPTEYLLVASCSEFVPLALQARYASVANTRSHDIVRAYRVSLTAGEAIPISGAANDRAAGELRFFRKGSVDYHLNHVHGRGLPVCAPDRVLRVVEDPTLHFFQFRDYDCSRTETVLCRYDDVLAKQRFDAGQRFSWTRALLASARSFAASYFWHGSWRFGMLGFLHCYYRWQMEFTIWLRIWEWQHGYSRANVIERNIAMRAAMEEQFRQEILNNNACRQDRSPYHA
jgi:glycosyltransferase involved in cell wall biosynthesis